MHIPAMAKSSRGVQLRGSLSTHPVAWIVGVGLVARLALGAAVPLTVDEAYYAHWASNLQPGYLDHPPLVAWLMAGALRLLGHAAFAARVPAALLQAGATLLAASLARARGGDRAALVAAVLLQAAPVFSLGAVLMTPDAPLAFAWAGALWALERAFRLGPRWLLAAGAFLGVAALSKLTAGLLGVAVLGALLTTGAGRRALATPWPWAGAAIALAIASPMLAWNAAHGWPSFTFQAQHGLSGHSFSLARLAGSLGAQAAYVSPVLLLAAVPPAWRALRDESPAWRAVAWSALPIAIFFTAAAAVSPGALPHWPAPGWLSASILLAVAAAGSRARFLRPAVATGLALQAVLLAALAIAPALPLPKDPLDELRGWRSGAEAARAAAAGRTIATTHWIVLGQLSWALGAPAAYVGDRPCGATYYQADPRRRPLLVVTVDHLGEQAPAVERDLGPLAPAGSFTATHRGHAVRTYRFWRWDPPAPR